VKNDLCRSTVRAEPVPMTKNTTDLLGIGTRGIAPFKLSGVFIFIEFWPVRFSFHLTCVTIISEQMFIFKPR